VLGGLAGKVAVVTGAASGIGAATARRLAEEDVRVVLVDVDTAAAERVAAELPSGTLSVPADAAVEADVDGYVAAAVEHFGRIDLHHLNAGIAGTVAPLPDIAAEEFDHVVAVNLRSVFLGLRAAFRQYAAQGTGGAIVTTASISGLRGASDLVPYHASKHGVIGLTRGAAVYGGPLGIRVNAVAPGIVPTGLFGSPSAPGPGTRDLATRAALAPLGRPGTPEEIASVVAFLLSDEAAFLTGEIVSVDGGAAALNPLRPSSARAPIDTQEHPS
jgi:NAD(P)-dependent dehydrogenase (short-subunit alcohol dehydrogenase family)